MPQVTQFVNNSLRFPDDLRFNNATESSDEPKSPSSARSQRRINFRDSVIAVLPLNRT